MAHSRRRRTTGDGVWRPFPFHEQNESEWKFPSVMMATPEASYFTAKYCEERACREGGGSLLSSSPVDLFQHVCAILPVFRLTDLKHVTWEYNKRTRTKLFQIKLRVCSVAASDYCWVLCLHSAWPRCGRRKERSIPFYFSLNETGDKFLLILFYFFYLFYIPSFVFIFPVRQFMLSITDISSYFTFYGSHVDFKTELRWNLVYLRKYYIYKPYSLFHIL